MQKTLLGLGVILLLVGVIVSSYASTTIEASDFILINETTRNSEMPWEVPGNFSKGEKLLVDVSPPRWGEEIIANGDTAIVDVEIFDPYDNLTEFRIIFKERLYPNFTLRSEANGLIVKNPSGEVGGVTVYDGEYRVHVVELAAVYYNMSAPHYIRIYEEIVQNEYPQQSYLPIGIISVVSGVILSVWSLRSSKQARRIRKKRL